MKLLAEEHNMQRTSLSRLVIYDMVPRSWKESGCTWSDYSEAISGSNIRSVWISKKLVGSKMASEAEKERFVLGALNKSSKKKVRKRKTFLLKKVRIYEAKLNKNKFEGYMS